MTYIGRPLYFTSELFCHPTSNLQDGPAAPCQKYINGWVLDVARKILSDISPTPPLIFTGGQKVQNLALYSTTLEFEPLWFGNRARYLHSFYRATVKHTHGIVIDFLCVCLSICPSVKRVYCDKTKAPSEESSIMTNKKSPTGFPMSLR